MENTDIARIIGEMAELLELTGGNAFKVRAYARAAQLLDTLPVPVAQLLAEGKLEDLPGIGEGIRQHIADLLAYGTFPEYEAVKRQVPPGVVEILRVEGVGPKTATLAWKRLKVESLDALEAACRDGRLEALPRMGPVRVQGILAAIERHRARAGRMLLHRAIPLANALLERLRAVKGVERAEAAGSLRRRKETVGDLDLLVASSDAEPVMRAFGSAPGVAEVEAQGPTRATARLQSGLQVDLRVVEPDTFGAALHYFTGSKAHNIALRTRAVRRGLKVSEYGVFDKEGRRLGGASEEDVFRRVGLPFIPPELREGQGELEAAEAGRLPKLVEPGDVRGDLHVHSDASQDAKSSLEELADAAHTLGRSYLAITDHTKARPLGLDGPGLLRVAEKVRALSAERSHAPHLLTGAEVDILPDGSLDAPDEVLAQLDCVVAGVHAHFNDSREAMTKRLVRAMQSGRVHILAHPGGRQLGTRDAYAYDLEKVLEVAKETNVALEVNAQPDRLDLTDQGCRLAKAAGVRVVISTDAHHESQLANLEYGVWVARRGWLEKQDVLNALPLERFLKAIRRAPPRAAPPRRTPPARRRTRVHAH